MGLGGDALLAEGYANMGYVWDKKVIDEAMVWINGTLNSQRDNGDFGPYVIRKTTGKRDLWAQMLMLFCVAVILREYSHDARVIDHMTKYFQWQLTIPENDFLTDYWENSREEIISTVCIGCTTSPKNHGSLIWLRRSTGIQPTGN